MPYYKSRGIMKIMQTMDKTQRHVAQYTKEQQEVIKSFFTDVEWDAIDSALADYQDYGEKETELMNSIGDKMYKLFNPKYQDENRHPASGAN